MQVRASLLATAVMLFAVGCGSTHTVKVNSNYFGQLDKPRKVAVMKFEAPPAPPEGKRSVAWGIVEVPDAGQTFAALVAHVLNGHLGMETVSRPDMLRVLADKKVDEEALVKQRNTAKINELFGVDTIVIGRIERWSSGYWLFLPRGAITFEMQCIDLRTGEKIWEVRSDCTMSGTDDRTTALKALREAIRHVERAVEERKTEYVF